ncbi:MAG: dUTP diphosphatase [Chitinispirillales bacterium]|jgi:dUTP pyrophosphatase|nr:dUTP diphosphatase [Chitinispirillales bacterium]
MTSTKISVTRLPHAIGLSLPVRMTPGSSGCDVCAAVEGEVVINPGGRVLIPTGLRFCIPEGIEVQVRPRSGLALKHGVTVLNAPGTIDADYRGEVQIILINHGDKPFVINRGDRIAQLVPASVAIDTVFVEDGGDEVTDDTSRGAGGFGHTG